MSWSAARTQLVGIVAGVAPTIRKQGLPSKFKHDDNGSEGEPIGDSRRFWLTVKSGNALGHVQPTATHYTFSVDVVVEYHQVVQIDGIGDLGNFRKLQFLR